MSVINSLADRFRTLTPKQIVDAATMPVMRNPALRRWYQVENLTEIDQIISGIGEDGSGNSITFLSRQKKLAFLFDDEVEMLMRMDRIFKVKIIKKRPR